MSRWLQFRYKPAGRYRNLAAGGRELAAPDSRCSPHASVGAPWCIVIRYIVSREIKHPVLLVAEDNPDDVEMLQRAFEQLGFDYPVQYVANGEEAIAYLLGEGRFANRSEYPVPDLFLLDLKMPRKNGFEVLQWMRQQPWLVKLRTIVLTTSEDVYEINRAYVLGAASFLTKPLNFTEFRETIEGTIRYWLETNKPPQVERPERPPIKNPRLE